MSINFLNSESCPVCGSESTNIVYCEKCQTTYCDMCKPNCFEKIGNPVVTSVEVLCECGAIALNLYID